MKNKYKKINIFIAILFLFASCSHTTQSGTEAELGQQSSVIQDKTVLDTQASFSESDGKSYDSPIEKAIYAFPWIGKDEKPYASTTEAGQHYRVYFADMNFDGQDEILLCSFSDFVRSQSFYEIYEIRDDRLVHLGSFETRSAKSEGPDSWDDGQKAYYVNKDNQKVILQWNYCPDSNHTDVYSLIEVSLSDYTSVPILMYAEPDSIYREHGEITHYFSYNANFLYTVGSIDLHSTTGKEESLAEQGVTEISESTYNERMEEYLDSLEYIGDIAVSGEIVYYPMEIGRYNGFSFSDIDVVVEPETPRAVKESLFNQAIAEIVYKEYVKE